MQDLRSQLLKAGLVDKKKKKHADKQARTEKRKKGAATVAEEEAARQAEYEERRAREREEARRREKARQEERRRQEERYRLRDIVLQGVVREGRRGRRRFHFVTRGGSIPFVEVSEELGLQLEAGRAAIVEVPLTPGEAFEIVTRQTAEKIEPLAADVIRFWNH